MSEFTDRVAQIAEYYGLTKPADFAKKTGFSHQVASNYLKGTRIPNAEALSIIKRSFDISADWLLTGNGDMLINLEETPTEKHTPELENNFGAPLLDKLMEQAEEIGKLRENSKHHEETNKRLEETIKQLREKVKQLEMGKAESVSHANMHDIANVG